MSLLMENNGHLRGMMKTPSSHALRAHAIKRWLAGASTPRFGFDGISPDAAIIHAREPNANWVAGYDTQGWVWSAAEWNLFPKSHHVHIATQAGFNIGDVLDVESGDATPGQTEGWIRMRKAAGYYRPTIYCSLSTIPAVRAGTGPYRLGVDYDIWVAHWTGVPHQIPGCAATQYASANWADFDVAYDAGWPHRTAPTPPPPPVAKVTVPQLKGVSTATAVSNLSLLGLAAHLDRPTPAGAAGHVGSQTPAGGTSVAKGSMVDLQNIVTVTPPAPVPTPPPHVGKTRYVSTGTVSLEMAARNYGSTADEVVTCSLGNESVANVAALIKYISTGCGVQDTMPAGLVYWVPAHG